MDLKIYGNIDEGTINQTKQLATLNAFKNQKIRIMPDAHQGKGAVIGFTSTYGDEIIPNVVGVDIGCGMLVVDLGENEINLEKLDFFIAENIPMGTGKYRIDLLTKDELEESKKLICEIKAIKRDHDFNIHIGQIGSLGAGNHFLEIAEGHNNKKYLVVHSGSRNLGKIICEHYQTLAINMLPTFNKNELILNLKKEGREKEIEAELRKIPRHQFSNFEKETASIHGINRQLYLNDMQVAQNYASLNRKIMAKRVCDFLKIEITEENSFETIHNYIDVENGYIRKGAVSAQKEEKLIIPLNMRDGSLLCVGKGNEDWNYSAPHGAGRLMSRKQAKDNIKIENFIQSMEGIYSTTVNESTLDESPMAYKPAEDIINTIGDTVEIVEQIKPIYNRKG